MRHKITKRLLPMVFMLTALAGCDNNSSDTSLVPSVIVPPPSTGIVFDAPIAGLTYSTPTHSGVTNADGQYNYEPGEEVKFSLGNLSFDGIPANGLISLPDLAGTAAVDRSIINLARLLQSIDTDDSNERIQLPDLTNSDLASLDLTQTLDSFGSDPLVLGILSSYGNQIDPLELIDSQTALDHLVEYAASIDHQIPDLLPELDADTDGTLNVADKDDDNDGVDDAQDAFPLDATETTDTDGDGMGNNTDEDDDNDGIPDSQDALPTNPNETTDTDQDGVGDGADLDDDNDGVNDDLDAFPLDANETADTDADGVGNNADEDDDNDGVNDSNDAFPLSPTETEDADLDGIGNNADEDDDNDGVVDTIDSFPFDQNESTDTDLDGTGNNADSDDDNDGVNDTNDAFPLDQTETTDTDQDGTGNNADIDDDNDGVDDANDAFPEDANEQTDTDLDGTGNNADSDDDNDGVDDANDAFPLDLNETTDTDQDGTGNNADLDDDNDGANDDVDAFPLDANETADTDADGVGNNADEDDDNDGVLDADDAFPEDANEHTDQDSDGFGSVADCDDDVAQVYPGATELANKIDDNCDGVADENLNYFFITSGVSDGDLGGLRGADAICQSHADNSSLPDGLYRAWLSSSSVAAVDRLLTSDNPYYLPDGTLLANSLNDLLTQNFNFVLSPGNGFDVDENGNKLIGTQNAWSNTADGGTVASATEHCADWTSSLNSVSGGVGFNDQNTTGEWTDASTQSCERTGSQSAGNRLYCVQQKVETITVISPEPQGSNCSTDIGVYVERGSDNGDGNGVSGNGILEPGEVDNSYYNCGETYTLYLYGPTGGLPILNQQAARTTCEAHNAVLATWSTEAQLNELVHLCGLTYSPGGGMTVGTPLPCHTQFRGNGVDNQVSIVDGSPMPAHFGYLNGLYTNTNDILTVRSDLAELEIVTESPFSLSYAACMAVPPP